MRPRTLAWLAAGFLMLLAGGAVVLSAARHSSRLTPPSTPVAVAAAPRASGVPAALRRQADALIKERSKGSAAAALTVYELSDFQCPWCRRQATETLPILEKEYIETGKVRWIFLNFPLTQLHPNAAAAAEFAMCAAKIDKFWPIHDLLFTYQEKWAPLKDPAPFLLSLADSAGLQREDLTACLQSHEMQGLVRSEAEGAAKSGVQSTPTVYIEGVGMLAGAAPVAVFRQVLDSLWKEKTAKSAGQK
jgi:protein-disulfide isomerase